MGVTSEKFSPKSERPALRRAHPKRLSIRLPQGLVGAKTTAQVTIEGKGTSCLLDTGSQVTTVPQSFYEQHLAHLAIHPLNDFLDVEGANGQLVPYLGYIKLSITFPKDFVGSKIEIPTLALVIPHLRSATHEQVLIGTNTLDVLYTHFQPFSTFQPSFYGYRAVLKILETRQRSTSSRTLGWARMIGKMPEMVPAGQTVVLTGLVNVPNAHSGKYGIVEQPLVSTLPNGLLVPASLVSLPNRRPWHLSVMLKNETEHDIVIPPKTVLADVNAVVRVLNKEHLMREQLSAGMQMETLQPTNLSFDFGDSPLPTKWKERVTNMLNSMPEVFSHHDLDFGHTNKVKHHIRLSDETPFKYRARPIHPCDVDAVRKHLQELLDSGIIRESESPFASPIVVVRKKDGSVRLCIDFRKLNLQTIKDAYALPRLEETFSALVGSRWFSVLDLKSGYYQIEMEESDKPKTAFVCPLGFWEFNRMPQGITNAPSTFQRLMEKCVGEMNLREVLVFIDDLIIFSSSLEEHEVRLKRVLERLRDYGLKLAPEKCKFFQTSVRYLGHIVSERGVETDPEKVKALKTWPIPTNLKELRSFLGFAGYYRRFIQGYSHIIKPLNELTSGYPPLRKGNKKPKQATRTGYYNPKELFGQRWTSKCQEAFDSIIEKLTSAPVLGFADPQLPYILHTDASTVGLGAALYQIQDSQPRAIAFASRGLSKSERKYPAHKLEFLALKWAVTEKFSDYLYGTAFTVVTDSNPLTYLLTSAKLDATGYRWLSSLSTYSFQLQYRAGRSNLDADALSRRPHGPPEDDHASKKESERIRQFALHHLSDVEASHTVPQDVIQAICDRHLTNILKDSNAETLSPGLTLVESLAHQSTAIPGCFQEEQAGGFPLIPSFSEEELRDQQRSDPVINAVIDQIETGQSPSSSLREELPELPLLLRELNRLQLRKGVLYRRRQNGPNVTFQLVLPEKLRAIAFQSLHHDMGHMGVERTVDLIRSRFYWPKLFATIERLIKTCERCVRRKTPPERAAPLMNIKTCRPLELVCMDFLSLEPDRSNTKDVLVITDHFTKYAVALPTPNQRARTVAKCLWEHFIVHYGFPERLHSDQGPDFESKTIKELCDITGIKKVRTTPYHPRGNPVERFNRTLLQMLGTLSQPDKLHWKDFVKPLVHAYNCTKNDVTGFSPYELMFGRQPRLPVDLAFGLPVDTNTQSHSQYVSDLKHRLEESYKIATANAKKNADRNKIRFDKRVVDSTIEEGDRVLVRNVKLRGRHKLANKWEDDVYVVLRRVGDMPVYTVKPEAKDGPVRTLHRDLLLPCGFLSATTTTGPVKHLSVRKPRTRRCPFSEGEEEDNSDSENPIWIPPPVRTPSDVFITVHDIHRSKNALDKIDVSTAPVPSDPQAVGDGGELLMQNMPDTDTPPECDALLEHDTPPECDNQPDNDNQPDVDSFPDPVPLLECDLPDNVPVDTDMQLREEQSPSVDETRLLLGVDVQTNKVSEDQVVTEQPKRVQDQSDRPQDTEITLRRSLRQHEKPERLQYSRLGSPMLMVVNALFQGLSEAFVNSLHGLEDVDHSHGRDMGTV
uniref:Gypsy retrotransposon integrase-like protein 1 n=1 Tax=Paramormyrops kingsleyae TaxID=1676925 RepID=A0A3B3R4V1_9TELE